MNVLLFVIIFTIMSCLSFNNYKLISEMSSLGRLSIKILNVRLQQSSQNQARISEENKTQTVMSPFKM